MEQTKATSRSSRQREAVKADILGRYDHPTAEMVYLTVRETEPKISLATVYRNLDHLVDIGLVNKFMVIGEPDHYDVVRHEHYHIKCRNCGEIADVNLQLAEYFSQQIKAQTGMDMFSLQIVAEGVCENCKSQINMKGE